MNWFMVAGGLLWIGSAVQAFYQGQILMGIVSLCYAGAQFALGGVKG